jgi:hypothetical protein
MFDYISNLRPYFHSLREINENVSLDIKLPLNWQYDDIIKPYRSVHVMAQDKNDKFVLLSLISVANKEGYEVVYACAKEIIKINKEEEEKQKLFQQKVKELEELFKNQSLDKLKDINLGLKNGQETIARVELVGEGIGERQERNTEPQVKDDRGNKKIDKQKIFQSQEKKPIKKSLWDKLLKIFGYGKKG